MSYIDDRIDGMTEAEVRNAAKHYYAACVRQGAEIEAMVAPVLGYEYDERYGWIVGDHVAESLVAELIQKFKQMTA